MITNQTAKSKGVAHSVPSPIVPCQAVRSRFVFCRVSSSMAAGIPPKPSMSVPTNSTVAAEKSRNISVSVMITPRDPA